jgi:FtsH-binding integral membrane protein
MIQIFKTKVDANGQTITRKTKPIYFYLFFSMLCYVACIVLNIINAATPDSNPWPAIVLIVLTVINFIILFFAKRAHKATKQIVKQMGA